MTTNTITAIAAEVAAEKIRNRICEAANSAGVSCEEMFQVVLESGKVETLIEKYADATPMCIGAALCEDEFAQLAQEAYDA